jgi:hypothetical protein
MAKPRIFVSSTYYDLRHIRNSLEAFIETLGFESVLFESGDIPFHHDVPLDESCYAEIQTCHILVLIVGGRYGSPSSGKQPLSVEDREKACKAYNSITKREYEAARKKDIPIFIFVEKNVLAEHRTYKANRDNSSIHYAHVDNIGIFQLLDDILVQTRNNYIKDFEKFDDIATWLRDQWAGLFADFLTKKSSEKTVQDLSGQIGQLGQVAAVLKEYTESIMRKIEPKNFRRIISAQEKKLEAAKARRFAAEGMITFILTRHKLKKTPTALYSVFAKSKSLRDFLERVGLNAEQVTAFLETHSVHALRDYRRLRRSYVLGDEEPESDPPPDDDSVDVEGVDLDGP